MFSVIRASMELMDEVRSIINSNYDLYKNIVDEKDLSEHQVTEEWAERNYKIREFYVARDSGKYVGVASYQTINAKNAYIGYFYIRNGIHRKGLGASLMNFMELRTKQDGIKNLWLFVQSKAPWALSFYEKRGFKIIAKEKDEILALEHGALKPFYEEGIYLLEKIIDLPE